MSRFKSHNEFGMDQMQNTSVFISPELKAQMSYSEYILSVVLCPSVKCLHFELLL